MPQNIPKEAIVAFVMAVVAVAVAYSILTFTVNGQRSAPEAMDETATEAPVQ